jgi:hypothetical protein
MVNHPGRRRLVHTISAADIGKRTIRIEDRPRSVADFIGHVMPRDVGKRVYVVGDVLQVENDIQLRDRRASEAGL